MVGNLPQLDATAISHWWLLTATIFERLFACIRNDLNRHNQRSRRNVIWLFSKQSKLWTLNSFTELHWFANCAICNADNIWYPLVPTGNSRYANGEWVVTGMPGLHKAVSAQSSSSGVSTVFPWSLCFEHHPPCRYGLCYVISRL